MTAPTGRPRGRPRKAPLTEEQAISEPQQVSPLPQGTELTQSELVTHDFTGWDWRQLPYSVVKAARNGAVATWTIVGHKECVSCKRKMWTCDPVREDICEEDEYEQSREVWELRTERAKRNNMKPVNPFSENDKPTRTFWPLDES